MFFSSVTIPDLGDYVVSAESAQAQQLRIAGFGGEHDINCGGLTIGARRMGPISVPVYSSSALGCWHMSEPESDAWLDQVQRMVDWFTLRPVGPPDLQSAPVPALCNFPAGHLESGKLPASRGAVGQPPTLVTSDNRADVGELIALGDLNGDGLGDAAGVVNCNAGGVGWPDSIVFWAAGWGGPAVLGAYQMFEAVGDARHGTTSLTYTDGAVTVESSDSREGDNACCPTGRARVTLEWDGRDVVATEVEHLYGLDCDSSVVTRTMCDFTEAVVTGTWDQLTDTERAVAADTTDLPDDFWYLQSCELVGDISVECRVYFLEENPEPNSEPGTAATFTLTPSNGEYVDGDVIVPPGETLDYQVDGYSGLGV